MQGLQVFQVLYCKRHNLSYDAYFGAASLVVDFFVFSAFFSRDFSIDNIYLYFQENFRLKILLLIFFGAL